MSSKVNLSPSVIASLHSLELKAKKIVEGFLVGLHKSPWSGISLEYTGYRPYYPGDPIKHIDWKVWGRTDRYYIKQFEEETNTCIYILIDLSKSLDYGENSSNKWNYIQTLSASLAYLSLLIRDAPSIVFLQENETFILPPSAKFGQLKLIIDKLENASPLEKNPDWEGILRALRPRLKRRTMLFILSDFMFPVEDFKPALSQLRFLKGDLSLWQILHKDELEFPFDDELRFIDMESEDFIEISSGKWQDSYIRELKKHQKDLVRLCGEQEGQFKSFRTDNSFLLPLKEFLSQREKFR
ncbi:MAG: DUF58 domain-containing protein [Candidatus Coatesbacteria bacterium]|nr:DUF58 domain-containing protein [Candidatus Coatesbacteria bacterium]